MCLECFTSNIFKLKSKFQKVILLSKIFKLWLKDPQFLYLLQINQYYKVYHLIAAYQNQWTHNYYIQQAHLAQYFLLIMRQQVSMLSLLKGLLKYLSFFSHFWCLFSMLPLFLYLFFLIATFKSLPSQQLVFMPKLMQLLCLQHLIFSFFLIILVILFFSAPVLFSS